MSEWAAIFANVEYLRWVFLGLVVLVFARWMNDEDNPLEWRDFISSRGTDGTHYADINKLGQTLGIAAAVFVIVVIAPKAHTDFIGFAAVLLACFAFLGGAASYSAYLRAKLGRSETTVVTEPMPRGPVKTTVTESSPIPTSGGGPDPKRAAVDEPLNTMEPDNDFRR